MKHILMLATGGTIASKQTDDGLAPVLTPEDILSFVPAVAQVCRVSTLSVCNIDSTNMTPAHWIQIVRAVEENYHAYDGFVICHGTDTLAYTAAALSYMIQNADKPIVITGAQKPINMDVTDARSNLLDSFIYAADDGSRGVNIVFDGKVILGTRARKVRAKSYNAFSSLNYPYPAVIQDGLLVRYIPEPPAEGKVRFFYQLADSVCTLKLTPGIKPEIFSYLFTQYDCVVIESFGVGGLPQNLVDAFYAEMDKWFSKGKFVVMTTQVVNEGSNMTVYEVGKKVKRDFNLIEAYDMTFEATITKLMWILGQKPTSYDEVRRLFYTPVNRDTLFAGRID
ncbi:MAG: asparaginase [Clostridia bacterium]|nr:asparaginase [Clostridia bacterium]